jgi:enterochelin esterase family protein
LLHGLAGHRHPPLLEHLHNGTYAIAFDAPHVDRLEYGFQLVSSGNASQSIRDPNNELATEDPYGGKSVLLADGYRPPWYAAEAPPAAQGTTRAMTLPGPGGAQWPALLWLPPGDDLIAKLPLIIALDGEDSIRFARTINSIANLVSARAMARCRALFISPAKRNGEYSANPQTAALLSREIPSRLAPLLPLPDDPRWRIGLGQSLGALALLHAHWLYPSFFGGLVLQSGSFFQPQTDAMESKFAYFQRITSFVSEVHASDCDARPIAVRLTCGSGEENLMNNMRLADSLAKLGYDATLQTTRDAHNWTSWRDAMGPALQSLLPP